MTTATRNPIEHSAIMAKAAAGAKFTDAEVNGELAELAGAYLADYSGDFEFLLSVKAKHVAGRVSYAALRGVLNCMIAEAKRQAAAEAERQAVEQAAASMEEVGFWRRPVMVPDGYFTVVFEEGDHRTIRIARPKQGKYVGKQVLAYLFGPENTSDYQRCGVIEAGALVWFGGCGADSRVRQAVDFLLAATPADRQAAGKAYAIESGNCFRCGRLLTDETSISLGIGPKCRGGE